MGGGSSSPKYIDQTYIFANDIGTNNQNLINDTPEKFYDFNQREYYNNIIFFKLIISSILLIILLLFYFNYKKKKR